MLQTTYTSTCGAKITPCNKKGEVMKAGPIPLIKENFLSEFRTEVEKAKARKNLGIADENSLLWGNIDGTIEDQTDLVQYIEQKWKYTYSGVSTEITTVKEALDYALQFISQYDANTEAVEQLQKGFTEISNSLSEAQKAISTNATDIDTLESDISNLNEQIKQINLNIENIDVDNNIAKWVEAHLSHTIGLVDDKLEVLINSDETNAVQVLTDEEGNQIDGIYVKDLSSAVKQNTDDISSIKTYQTDLPDETTSPEKVGGIDQGTTVADLKGKSLNEIIDVLLFPAYVRDLVEPTLEYVTSAETLIEVGIANLNPVLTFTQNDAGGEESRTETITFNGSNVEELTSYTQLGEYKYTGAVTYGAGEYLVNNKGETTNKRIEAGSLTTELILTTTYPWYAGNTNGVEKQVLVPFNQDSGQINLSLSGRAIIKLPGNNSSISSFQVDGGLGYIDVDLDGWDTSVEYINGEPYKVWTKQEEYSMALPHIIEFTLAQ